jgi:SAM-dependent methyltransferase
MSDQDANSSAAAPGIQSSLDSPVLGQKVYDKSIYVSGWVHCEGKDPGSCRVCAYIDDAYVGETRMLASRPDVCEALKLPRGIATGFRMLGRMESAGSEPREAMLRVTASWADGVEHVLTERPVRVVPALLRSRPYGEVVYPENEKQLHRENIYGSGPPLEDPGAETAHLLNEYLPDGASVVDIGCGAGAYGPGLLANGHEWLGLEANTFCCEILQRRQLPFRKVDLESPTLPCADGEWDCAICIEVLEHVRDPETFLSEIARMTHRRTLFSVPNMEVLPYLHGWGVVPWHLLEGDHRNFFTRGNLRALLGRFFRDVEVFPYGEHPLRTREEIPVHVHLFAVADK